MGYPDRSAETQILTGQRHTRPGDSSRAVTDGKEIEAMQWAVRDVHVDPSLQEYILDVVGATRTLPAVALGASPRGSLALLYAAQAMAALQERDFVKPDDIK